MLLDLRTGVGDAWVVAGVAAAVLFVKAAIAAFAGLVLRFPVRIALLAGFGVAQIGEFSFVLGRQGADLGLLTAGELRVFLTASVITMFIAPLALRFGPGLAAGASRLKGVGRLDTATAGGIAPQGGGENPQVVILGYGVGGELLAEVLREAAVPFVALDLNAQRVRQARREGSPLYYGDVTSREILERAGVATAEQVVVVLNDSRATLHAVRVAREVGPEAVIIARARYVGETHALLAAGADEVVAQELEASFAVIERVTRGARVPRPGRVSPTERRPGVALLPAGLEAESAVVPEGAWIAGRSLVDADLRRRTGATLVAYTREGDTAVHPSPEDVLQAGDVLSLLGNDTQLAAARALIASGPQAEA
jgi:CPA2 family monovalent cation:H+ antiporter-2